MADEDVSPDLELPQSDKRNDERAILAALLLRLRKRSRDWLEAAPQPIDHEAFADMMRGDLLSGHTEASFLGRSLAGSSLPIGESDRLFAETIMAEQEPYLAGFAADIAAGRYTAEDGAAMVDSMAQRAGLYADVLVGTANEAWAEMQDGDTKILWILGGNEDHCPDCPDLAEGSPYTRDTLPCYPGDGSTECLGNCLCTLEALSVRAFSRGDQPEDVE